MGYDVDFIRLQTPSPVGFPISGDQTEKLLSALVPWTDPSEVREILLNTDGCRPGPDDSIDYLGKGLSYARFFIREKVIHVENNATARDLVTVYGSLLSKYPDLLIHDLQSNQIHSADSFCQWWSRPL